MEFAEFIRTPMVDGVTLHRPHCQPISGTLCVTGHHLILSSRQGTHEELWLLHKNVDSVVKKLSGPGGVLILKCKQFKILQLEIPQAEACINIATSVEQLSNIENVNLAYPFFHRPMFEILEDGWQAFPLEAEFSRLKSMSDDWRLSYVNKMFNVCQSYPQAVIVPKSIDDDTLKQVAAFRYGGRFPVLSYYHKDNGMVMLRSSQPLTGGSGRRCREDEKLLRAVLRVSDRGYIVDTRSVAVAKTAATRGGGYEADVCYSQWKRVHQTVERHSALQESLIKFIEACYDSSSSMDKWLSRQESSGWLSHVKDVITGACFVAQCIDKDGASVLVHGGEGLDATLQMTSLAQLILDPDCRTIRGFEAMIEREWLQAGHPFAKRNAKSAFAMSHHRHEAPVFLLFLDCVWQIWQQYPCSFEFSEEFLVKLFEHSYASMYGTFLCNNEQERQYYKLSEKTTSLWSYLNRPEILTQFINPLYEPNNTVIWPSVAPQSLMVWKGLYLRWQISQSMEQDIWQEITVIKERDKELKSKAMRLRRHLATLEKEAVEKGLIPGVLG